MADAPNPPAPSPTRGLPAAIIASMVVLTIGWLTLLYVTRPAAPASEAVDAVLTGAPGAGEVAQRIALSKEGGGGAGTVYAGIPDSPALSWDHVGGVVIVHLPPAEIRRVEGDRGEEERLRAAALAGGILTHAEAAVAAGVREGIEALGYRAEVHFDAPAP